jgi:hypothetical protein
MSGPHVVTGRRAAVDVGRRTPGWAWHCRNCQRGAGLESSPFTDDDVQILPTLTVWMTGEQRALSAARMHADHVCPKPRRD